MAEIPAYPPDPDRRDTFDLEDELNLFVELRDKDGNLINPKGQDGDVVGIATGPTSPQE